MKRFILSVLVLAGCANSERPAPLAEAARGTQTLGSEYSGFTYIPLDPLTISHTRCARDEEDEYDPILDLMPDQTVRISIRNVSGGAEVTAPIGSVAAKGSRNIVVVDYINVDNTNIPFYIRIQKNPGTVRYTVERKPIGFDISKAALDGGPGVDGAFVPRLGGSDTQIPTDGYYVIPVYAGVGLRLTADVSVLEGEVKLSSLVAIGAAAQANRVAGSLTIQTLGLTGKQVAAGLTFTSDLSEASIQSALLSLGKIKTILYTNDVVVTPRVTGMYLPIRDASEDIVNLIVSELAREDIPWKRPEESGCTIGQ